MSDLPALASSPSGMSRWWRAFTGWISFQRALPGVSMSGGTRDNPVLTAGADYAGSNESRPSYAVDASMSAYAGFPWVYAALIRASSDLAGLPLVVYQGRGSKRKRLDDHPLYRLLEQPSRRVTGRQFRAQQVVDLILAGNAFSYTEGVRQLARVMRLHPHRVSIKPDPYDCWGDYLYDGGGQRLKLDGDLVQHVRLPSWSDDPRGLWGTGAIETLHDDLTTDRRAARSASMLAKRARPDVIISPSDPSAKNEVWGETFRDQLKKKFDQLLESGGTVVVGSGAKIDMPSWSPRDIEFPALRQLVREAVLAVTGVPPHMVGLPTATYAADMAQEASYWGRMKARAADIEDSCFTPWARMWGDDLFVVHDFSGVAILQEPRTAALDRVMRWWSMGMLPSKAAAMEGIEGADFSAAGMGGAAPDDVAAPTSPDAPAATPAAGVESVADTALNGAQVSSLLEIVLAVSAGSLTADAAVGIILVAFPTITEEEARRVVDGAISLPKPAAENTASYRLVVRAWCEGMAQSIARERKARAAAVHASTPLGTGWMRRAVQADRSVPVLVTKSVAYDDPDRTTAMVVPETADGRADLWRGFVEQLHGPTERKLTGVSMIALREQAKRIAAKLRNVERSSAAWQAKNAQNDILAEIFDDATENAEMREAVTAALREALRKSFGVGARQVGHADLVFDPVRLNVATDEVVGEMVTQVNATTKAAVRGIIRLGLNEGDTTADMAARLITAEGFSPMRANRIARTETTKSVNAGSLLAYADAEELGTELEVEWLSSRDSSVRDEHEDLDGTRVAVGGKFKIGSDEAEGPGGFSNPKHSVNCRCTVVPRVKKADA